MKELTEDEPRVKISMRDRDPKGACVCRNIGVQNSTGKYVIFLDTDDLLEPHCLQQRVDVMEQNPDLDLAFFPCRVFEKTPGDLGLWWNVETDRDLLERQFHQDSIAQGTGVIWKKASFEKIGMWGEHLAIWQDIDMFLRTFIQDYKYKICFDLPADLLYRRHESLSRVGFFSRSKVESRCTVVRDAVSMLEDHGKSDSVRLARFMVGDVVYAAARGRHFDLAKELLIWATNIGVLNTAEQRTLRLATLACRARLVKFECIRRWVESKMVVFQTQSFVGQVSDSLPLIQRLTHSA